MSWLGKLIGGKEKGTAASGREDDLSAVRLVIDRKHHKVAEIGVRTFRIHPYQGELIANQHLSFTMILTMDGDEFKFPGSGVVRELTPERGLMVQFQAPQPFFDRKLTAFVAHRKLGAPPAPQAATGAAGAARKK